ASPPVAYRSEPAVGVTPRRPRRVPNHSSLCFICAVTGASMPKAPSAGLQVAPAQANVVVRSVWREFWMSPSMPATNAPHCQLKPACAPYIVPVNLPDVLVAARGVPAMESLMVVFVSDLPQA